MTRWIQLRKEIDEARIARGPRSDWQSAMVVQLKRAAGVNACNDSAPYWVSQKEGLIGILKHCDAWIGTHRAIALRDVPGLCDTRLTFRIVVDRSGALLDYTVGAQGTEKTSGRGWYVRVDLDTEQKGQGPCGHPMLHCHMGVDPGDKQAQAARTPMPWLDPDEALAWILATLYQHLEPDG